MTERDFTSD